MGQSSRFFTEELEQERDAAVEGLRKHFASKEEIAARIQSITKQVEDMITNKTAFVKFDGKSILRKFYQKFVSGKAVGMSFEVFCYSVAERIGSTGRTSESIKKTLTSIKERLNTSSTPSQS